MFSATAVFYCCTGLDVLTSLKSSKALVAVCCRFAAEVNFRLINNTISAQRVSTLFGEVSSLISRLFNKTVQKS